MLAGVELLARAVPLVTDKTMIPFREMPGDEAFAPRPSASARTLKGVLETTNRHGLRDPERSLTRPEHGPARIALLGDSVVWGFGLDADDAIPRKLETELAAAGVGVEAWTLAHPATNLANHRARWARLGPQIDADVLVVFVVFNDLLPEPTRFRVTDSGLLANPDRSAPFPDAIRPWLDRSAAYALSLRAVYAWEQSRQPSLVYSLEHGERLRADLDAILAQEDIPALVVAVPTRHPSPEEFAGLVALLEGSDAPVLDLGAMLGQPPPEALLQPTDSTHPNRDGAERIAREVAAATPPLLRDREHAAHAP